MKRTLLLTALLAFNLSAITYEDESSETREYYIKLNVAGEKSDSGAMARIEIKLFDNENIPLAGVPVALNANCGIFQCYPPGENSIPDSLVQKICFTTDVQGVATVYLVNIPYNVQVNIRASAEYGGMTITGSGNISFTRKQTKQVKK